MKLCLGTAQVGSKYGLLNKKIDKNQLDKIIKYLQANKINVIDTAISYGNAYSRLSKYNLKKFRIITKFNLPKKIKKKEVTKYIINKVQHSLYKMNIDCYYGLLIHDSKDLISYTDEIKAAFKNLKKNNKLKKDGISIYSETELEKIKYIYKPNIIQIPINIFNQKFLLNKNLKLLKKNKTEVYVRSIFLRGLLLSDEKTINNNKKLPTKLKSKLITWFNWCKKKNLDKIKILIDLIKHNRLIDYLIVGVDDYNQLLKINKNFKKKKINISLKKFNIDNKKLTDPRLW